MTDLYPAVEGFFVTTLAGDLTVSSSTVSLTALPTRITKGYMVVDPSSATKREVIHFTSVGVSSVTTADDTTDASDATGRGCLGSVSLGATTTHDQGATVIIAAVEQYWARVYSVITAAHNIDGTFKSGAVLTLPQINDTSSDHQYVVAVSELAADRTITLPLLAGNDTFVFADFIQTLTNKTLTSPVLNTAVSGTAVLDEDNMVSNSATQLATQQSIKAYVDTAIAAIPAAVVDGWTAATGTWTYASASTITVPSGAASLYQKGDRIKWTQTTVKYGVIAAVADTLLTIFVNNTYVVTNAAITAIYYSHEVNPIGYPHWFDNTPTLTGGNADLSGFTSSRFNVIGTTCFWEFSAVGKSLTGSAGEIQVSYPVTNVSSVGWAYYGFIFTGSANVNTFHRSQNTYHQFYKTSDAGNWVANETNINIYLKFSFDF